MSNDNTKFSISIVGGGICGVLCAIGLNKAGIKVDVFEAAVSTGSTSSIFDRSGLYTGLFC